jgi:hypothetical protein
MLQDRYTGSKQNEGKDPVRPPLIKEQNEWTYLFT